jgi:hypothetical protein
MRFATSVLVYAGVDEAGRGPLAGPVVAAAVILDPTRPIREAFEQAVRFVRIAILSAPGLGAGHGPIGHHLGVVPFDEIEG